MKRIKGTCCLLLAGALAMGNAVNVQAEKTDAKKQVNVDGVYHAALGLETGSTSSPVYRKSYYNDKTYGTRAWKKAAVGTKEEGNYQELTGTFKDAKIKGNGTYTVSAKNINYMGQRKFAKLYVATDIPNSGKIKFSNMKVTVNGVVRKVVLKPYIDKKRRYSVMMAIDQETTLPAQNVMSPWCVPRTTQSDLTIQFDVKGFSYNKGDAVPTATPEITPAPEPTSTPEVTKTPQPEETPKVTSEAKDSTEGLTKTQRQVGIVVTIILAIGGIIGSLIVVNGRKR